jgi:hypothetical protein
MKLRGSRLNVGNWAYPYSDLIKAPSADPVNVDSIANTRPNVRRVNCIKRTLIPC